ncbi:MAG: alanine--tRNA ligase [Acidimicrobiales bacterium]
MVGSERLRSEFVKFFVDRGHVEVPSASLVPPDPSIMFTIAGMVQFKPYFLGLEAPPWPRATTVQRCFRTSDIEIVGATTRHCTFFEMLGNFSFGDYFKEGAITYAWEFVTETLGIDGGRLWVTVYEDDDEAEQIWRDGIGVQPDRIQRMGDDNFWKMGDTGPCGPCSEIYFDRGESYGAGGGPAKSDSDRYVEIWNLVFMGMERTSGGVLRELPRRNIDTGAGLERILPIVDGVESMFDTDLFVPLLEKAQSITGVRQGRDSGETRILRVMADHARAMVCLVADGVIPSNEGRGNVLRRIIRRAVLRAFQLGASSAVCAPLGAVAVDTLGGSFEKLEASRNAILDTLDREEAAFRRTLERGHATLDQELSSGHDISGLTAFTLHDTYGFPIELTMELAGAAGVSVDFKGYEEEMEAQRNRARQALKASRSVSADGDANELYMRLLEESGPTVFVGYDTEEVEATLLAIVPASEPGVSDIILDRTPFYAESGGQVGDMGEITAGDGAAQVLDTQSAAGGIFVHRARISDQLHPGDTVRAIVDSERRADLRRNHTGTHLLHSALRQVLGDHVHQQGSLVAPGRLRFDFSHHSRVLPVELNEIMHMANADVVSDAAVHTVVTDRATAESMGALAFFGDRYGNEVRVVKAGEHSTEFCGGTHVGMLGQIGPIMIVSESSIGSNTRRIEAVTGMDAARKLVERSHMVESASRTLNVEPDELLEGIERLVEQKQLADKELARQKAQRLDGLAYNLAGTAGNGILIARVDGLIQDDMRDVALKIRGHGTAVTLLAGSPDGSKAAVAVATDGSRDARELVKDLAGIIKGGGGGSAEVAVAGGKDVSRLDELLERARRLIAG